MKLADLINQVLVKEGSKGKARLCMEIERSEQMLDRYRNGRSNPSSDVAYKLAVACGCNAKEADRIAREYFHKARETA